MLKFTVLFYLCCIVASIDAQTPENGVPLTLAAERRAIISQLSYQLSFNIPAQKSANIKGTETIHLYLQHRPSMLQLDFRQDASHVSSVVVNDKPLNPVVVHEHLVIDSQFLQQGNNNISIEFIAGNESLNRNNDYLYALFVPDRARTVFPCFDQPDLKANFTLTLSVPSRWKVLANASLQDSIKTDTVTTFHFRQSDKLPTYLFSFTAGKYAAAQTAKMRFLFRETDSTKIRLSVDSIFKAHNDAIRFLEGWTGIPYPFQKIGFVAIPSFQFGGMEHPGEVQYNAGALFLDEGATQDQFIARSNVISHETAHMWFGDMVTMQWFNDVWMKEVFANFMADKVTEKMTGSELFNLKFLLDHTPAAYNVDRTPGANPIRQPLDNLQDAGSLYGNIIYHKAPIMMRQLELLMGKDSFQTGVQQYLKKYKYANATWDDLIAILSTHTKEDLFKWNQVWVNRAGRPVFNYTISNKQLVLTQMPERGSEAIWPQRFAITLLYGGSQQTIDVNMKYASIKIPLSETPAAIIFNADGRGYGLFPPSVDTNLYQLKNPVQRAAAYINNYENMLAGRIVKPVQLLNLLVQALTKETNELNLRLVCGYMGNIFWNYLKPEERLSFSTNLESNIWTAMMQQTAPNNKKLLFKAYQDIYLSSEANANMLAIWQTQKAPANVKLTEDDFTALSLAIALRTDTTNNIIEQQMNRVGNADRKARLQFIMPALSPDEAKRDSFFLSLKTIDNRRKESWVVTALAYLNHPLRQSSFVKFLPTALDMLEEVQRTGDVFFPQNWLGAIFGSYQSKEARDIVQHFIDSHPGYNPKLLAKIQQATDNLYRAQRAVSN